VIVGTGEDALAIVNSYDKRVHAIWINDDTNKSGKKGTAKWTYDTDDIVDSSPVIIGTAPFSLALIGSNDHVRAIRVRDGENEWAYNTAGKINPDFGINVDYSTINMDEEEVCLSKPTAKIIVNNNNGEMHCIDMGITIFTITTTSDNKIQLEDTAGAASTIDGLPMDFDISWPLSSDNKVILSNAVEQDMSTRNHTIVYAPELLHNFGETL
jgi:hypothetical protein